MFLRPLAPLLSVLMTSEINTFTFTDLGGSTIDPFLFIRLLVVNISESQTYDFETFEMSGVASVKFRFQGHVTHKFDVTEQNIQSPLLVMTDTVAPVAYVYPDSTLIGYPESPHYTKSQRQEINYTPDTGLPVILRPHFDVVQDVTEIASIPRYAIKGNWHYFSQSILCDDVRVIIRPRIKSGILLTSYNFL